MPTTARTIKLGRLFMVAFLVFYILPIWVILSRPYLIRDQAEALGLLLASAAVWVWFWTRVVDGPDGRFRVLAVALGAMLIGLFTLMTPPRYGTLWIYVVVMIGAAFQWRIALPLIGVAALAAGALDLIRGAGALDATGEFINAAIVGVATIAARLLLEANRQLSLAREQVARLAVSEERLRFARDLHDLLGHSLSVIALKSELARRLIKPAPGLAAHEVSDIEKVARQALREVREAVAGYRQPTLAAEIAGAREAMTVAGIELEVEDEHERLPPAVEALLAWTVREGATNVLRHSGARRSSIRIKTEDDHATAEIVDDGRGGAATPGSGLMGLRERVEALGGSLSAEPLPHAGFQIRVDVPLPSLPRPHAVAEDGMSLGMLGAPDTEVAR